MGKLLAINNWVKNAIVGLVFILSYGMLWYYRFWFISPLSTFINWYPNWGLFVWWAKNAFAFVLLIGSLLSVFYFWKLNRELFSNPKAIYIKLSLVYFILLLFFEGYHPFTMVKMYSRLDDSVNYFYIDDCKGVLIPLNRITNKSGGEISHYYYNFSNNNKINSLDVGALMWQQLNVKKVKIKSNCMCLNKKTIGINSKKELLYETCN